MSWHSILHIRLSSRAYCACAHQYCVLFLMQNHNNYCACITVRGRFRDGVGVDVYKTRGVMIRVSCVERFRGSSKWKWSSLSPWSGDFGVSRACACHYVVVWNALDDGSYLVFLLSSIGMFPWQRSTVCVSRCRCLNVKCLFIVIITIANKYIFYKGFKICYILNTKLYI